MLILRQSTQIRNLYCYQNNSFSGNKYNGYRRIFAFKTDKGRDNQIAHPIYLPALSTSPDSVKTVGGNEDVILKIPGLAGFQMKVKANSVTFPDGSRTGTLIVSPVTADKRATVSEDGSVLITDSGSGITKAGWGGLCRYDPDKCGKTAPPKECDKCQKFEAVTSDCPTGKCVPDSSKDGDRLATFNGKISVDTKPISLMRRYLVPLGAFVEAKGSAAFGYGGDLTCCAQGILGRGAKAEGTLSGDFEIMAAIPLLPVLKKFSSFIFSNFDVGPSIVGKLGFSGGGSGSYDWCKNAGEITAKMAGSAEFALSAGGGQFPVGLPNSTTTTGEIRPLDVGVVGQGELTLDKWVAEEIQGETRISLDLFIRSQVSIGTLSWTALDIRAPLISDIKQRVQFPVPRPY